MKFLVKLSLLIGVLMFLAPIVAPDTSVGRIAGAAIEDVGSFCERRAEACDQGIHLVRSTGDMIASAILSLRSEQPEHLTEDDRALAPFDAARARKSALAAHNEPAHY